ncbi:beta-glucanase [Asticcacaulis biprosthecium C19]|uniref:Beta-glucanase n=1 Tax=Asticcacaulis biprosthecium C19 TaxID=715226 RepID=F4QLY5_9CAUL|nr:glycoside hydrolase family 16 protein [Asticcacaulis biprosthecium]EGF93557.1 beta-glucanase [Asticcacaulis biprosthecium C19]
MNTTAFPKILSAVAVVTLASLAACGGGGGGSSGGGGGGGSSSSSSSSSTASGPGITAIDEAGGLPVGYNLAWADEFSTDGLPDPTLWGYDTFRNSAGWYNNEKQYYSASRLENARVEGGKLLIEARKEALTTMPDYGGQQYSSARVVSKKTYTYGYVEVRALVPCARGGWPAIWQLPAAPYTNWPDDGEIDIMEYVGWNPGKVYQSVHTKAYYHVLNNQKSVISNVADACSAWHTYQLTWTADRVLLGFDGRNYFSYRNDGTSNYNEWPFFRPQFLLLNVAVGGDFGGVSGVDDAAFPYAMQIDYVRVYQKP